MATPSTSKTRAEHRKQPLSRYAAFLAAVGFLLSLVHLFRQLEASSQHALGLWLNSDTMWLANVFTDVFRDHFDFSGWALAIVGFWFPDMTAVGLFWVLTRNVVLATLFAGFIQIPLLIGAFAICRRALCITGGALQNTLLFATGVAATVYVAADTGRSYPALYELLVPQTHVGSLFLVLLSLGLGLLWIRRRLEGREAGSALVLAYVVVCVLAGMSNPLFFAHFLLPFTIVVWIAELARLLQWKQGFGPVMAGWMGAAAGITISRYVFHSTSVSAQGELSISRMATALDVALRGWLEKMSNLDNMHLLALAWSAVCAGFTIYGLRGIRELDGRESIARKLLWMFLLVCLLSNVLGVAALIAGGSNGLTKFQDYTWTMHYWHPTFLLPIFGFPLLAAWIGAMRCSAAAQQRAAMVVGGIAVVIPIAAIAAGRSPAAGISAYRPPLVRFVDELAARKSLHYGYAGYWQARPITLLSARGVRAYAVDGSLHPLLWVSNREWYSQSMEDRAKPPKIDFVILDDEWKLTREAAVRALGEPAEEIQFEGRRILLYPGVSAPQPASRIERPLTSFRQSLTSSMSRVDLHPREEMVVPVEIRNPGSEAWSGAGKYPVTVSYKWFEAGRMLPIEGERTVFAGTIAPGGTARVDVRVVGVDKPGRYALRITLVQEGVAWFMTKSDTYLELPATVHLQ